MNQIDKLQIDNIFRASTFRLAIVMFACMLPHNSLMAQPIIVEPGGFEAPTIAGAFEVILSQNLEDPVIVLPVGVIQENVIVPPIEFTMRGSDPENPLATVIDGGDIGPVFSISEFDIPLEEMTFENLTIENGSGSGVFIAESSNVLFVNTVVQNNQTFTDGGGFSIHNSNVQLENCVVQNNQANAPAPFGKGGGLFIDEGSVIGVVSTTISNNQSTEGGGFFLADGSSILSELLIEGNSAEQGGAFFVDDGAELEFSFSLVEGNSAELDNVVIDDQGNSTIILNELLFSENTSVDGSAGVASSNDSGPSPLTLTPSRLAPAFEDNRTPIATRFGRVNHGPQSGISQPTIMNCVFENNTSENGAGAISLDGTSMLISGCSFNTNHSDGSFDEGAGAIVCNNASPTILDCMFTENTSRVEVGAIRNTNGASPLIQNCMFIGNSTDRTAGAIFIQNGSNPMIVDCHFEMNMTTNASSEGGAIFCDGGSPIIDNCSFTANLSRSGGAICSEDGFSIFSNPQISDCSFINNVALNVGGAIDATGSYLVLENCQFDNNQAISGGAISVSDSSANLSILSATNCSFLNHSVDVDGAAMIVSDTEGTFCNCLFSNNSAGRNGGALRNLNSALVFKYCDFVANDATELGGAIGSFNSTNGTHIGCKFSANSCGEEGGAAFYSTSSIASYLSCQFSGNTAGIEGGAIISADVPGDLVSNCTFNANNATNAGDAIACKNGANVTINNSILWENDADPIHIESGSVATVSFSIVQGGFTGVGNLDADPLFVDAVGEDGIPGTGDEDLSLQAGSPGNDAGDNDAVPADTFDLDGDLNVTEPLPLDLQMMVRFADDPDAPDVGNGNSPIVDIGAIEFSAVQVVLGDVNLDGVVNLLDVDPFIERVASGSFQAEADCNQDGTVNLLDVGPFIVILGG